MAQTDGYFSLAADFNKYHQNQENGEGVVGDELPELALDMSDDELLQLKMKWENRWTKAEPELTKRREVCENYWLGKQYAGSQDLQMGERPLADNLLFEALETFLPIATRANPQPLVESDNTEEGIALAGTVQKQLAFLADQEHLKLKIKEVVRSWALYFVGVAKVGYSSKNDSVTMTPLRPQKLILDPEGTITVGGEYTGEFIGEVRKDTGYDLVRKFPKKKTFFVEELNGKMGTELQYTEWWTDEYVFWTYKKEILDKQKNPHFNYEREVPTGMFDEAGQEMLETVPGNNHFKTPQKPYVFLSIFNLGKHPWDVTSLIEQNLANQDIINKRIRQIDKNADSANGGIAVSGDFFSREEAERAAAALRRGGTVWVPRGAANAAVTKVDSNQLASFVYNQLVDIRGELRNIFGTRGSTPAGTEQEQTVRGKIIIAQQDSSRIGGGVTEYIEQFVDRVYNWWVQLMYVYYDEAHTASVVGADKAREYTTLQKGDFKHQLLVSVKEGSLIPKDPLTRRNEAIDLWSAGAIDPITLFDRLDFPNPREAAKRLVEWKTNPQMFLGGGQQQAPQQQMTMAEVAARQSQQPQGVVPNDQLLSTIPQ